MEKPRLTERLVKDLMIPLTDYPHIPYWYSVRQAIAMIKAVAQDPEKKVEPRLLLVFDEKYQLLGYVSLPEMLRGIEPRFLRPPEAAHFQGVQLPDLDLGVLWQELFTRGCQEEAKKPVSEVMAPIRATIKDTDPIVKAAYAMVQTGMEIIPVMEANKVVGITRMIDIFDELTAAVLER